MTQSAVLQMVPYMPDKAEKLQASDANKAGLKNEKNALQNALWVRKFTILFALKDTCTCWSVTLDYLITFTYKLILDQSLFDCFHRPEFCRHQWDMLSGFTTWPLLDVTATINPSSHLLLWNHQSASVAVKRLQTSALEFYLNLLMSGFSC